MCDRAPMRLGLQVGYSGAQVAIDINQIREAESLGYHSVWTAEAWGSDAVSPLAWIGAQTTKIKAQAAELCDGILLTCMDPERFDVIGKNLDEGFAKSGRSLANFDVAPTVAVVMGDDLDLCRGPLKMSLALYIGGMGARDKNFFNR